MEYIAENAGHVPVPELVRGALLEMADNEERAWMDKVNAFRAEVAELEEYKLATYTPDELEYMEVVGDKSCGDWTQEHSERVDRLLVRAASFGLEAPHVICKCPGCEHRFRKSLQSAEDRSLARRMRAVAATLCRLPP